MHASLVLRLRPSAVAQRKRHKRNYNKESRRANTQPEQEGEARKSGERRNQARENRHMQTLRGRCDVDMSMLYYTRFAARFANDFAFFCPGRNIYMAACMKVLEILQSNGNCYIINLIWLANSRNGKEG